MEQEYILKQMLSTLDMHEATCLAMTSKVLYAHYVHDVLIGDDSTHASKKQKTSLFTKIGNNVLSLNDRKQLTTVRQHTGRHYEYMTLARYTQAIAKHILDILPYAKARGKNIGIVTSPDIVDRERRIMSAMNRGESIINYPETYHEKAHKVLLHLLNSGPFGWCTQEASFSRNTSEVGMVLYGINYSKMCIVNNIDTLVFAWPVDIAWVYREAKNVQYIRYCAPNCIILKCIRCNVDKFASSTYTRLCKSCQARTQCAKCDAPLHLDGWNYPLLCDGCIGKNKNIFKRTMTTHTEIVIKTIVNVRHSRRTVVIDEAYCGEYDMYVCPCAKCSR